jgi:hypothetical protein
VNKHQHHQTGSDTNTTPGVRTCCSVGKCGKCYVQSKEKGGQLRERTSRRVVKPLSVHVVSVLVLVVCYYSENIYIYIHFVFDQIQGTLVYITFIPKPKYYHHVHGVYICAFVKISIFHYRWFGEGRRRKAKAPTTTTASDTKI